MITTITLTIEHKKPIPDLLDKVAGRSYTIQGVDDVIAIYSIEQQAPEISFPEIEKSLLAAAEREECAKVCEDLPVSDEFIRLRYEAGVYDIATLDCAAAIRARGQQ